MKNLACFVFYSLLITNMTMTNKEKETIALASDIDTLPYGVVGMAKEREEIETREQENKREISIYEALHYQFISTT